MVFRGSIWLLRLIFISEAHRAFFHGARRAGRCIVGQPRGLSVPMIRISMLIEGHMIEDSGPEKSLCFLIS